MTEAALLCHPATPVPWLAGIAVRLAWDGRARLTLVYTVSGDLARLKRPPSARGDRVDGLWRHTCLEAFVMGRQAPAYREYNFAPSGAWQAYDFATYRRGGLPAPIRPPHITCQHTEDRLTLTAGLASPDLPPGRPLRIGLSAVIEDQAGQLSYWALAHPGDAPDFHHPDAFRLRLDPP